MRGEWGRFFPAHFSPFSYEETVANEWYPLTRGAAEQAGFFWRASEHKDLQAQSYQVPDRIDDVLPDIVDHVLACTVCGKNYKIVLAELQLYRQIGVPVPRTCTDCREQERLKRHGPWQLWDRHCKRCNRPVRTTFSPNQPEQVYCEECFLGLTYSNDCDSTSV